MALLADTEFKVFAQLLATKYRKGRKVEAFAQELFKEIYLPESEDDPDENTLPRTYRGYYYGQNDITELASQIAGSLDTSNFASYLQTDSDDTIESLCEAFCPWYPDIDADNHCQRIAARFKDIIDYTAAPKTKIAPPAVVAGRGVPGSLIDYNALMRKYGVSFVRKVESAIYEEMVRINDFIYDSERPAPRIDLKKGGSYKFFSPDDDGTGTNFSGMIVFDLSILRLTQIPAISHDSLIFKNIADLPIDRIFQLYQTSPKQIFVVFDKKDAFTQTTQDIIDATTVIELHENGGELFGWSWAKKTKEMQEVKAADEQSEE